MTPAQRECVRLVRWAVYVADANLAAIRQPELRPDRVPGIAWERDWYPAARAAVRAMDTDTPAVDLDMALGVRCKECGE